MKVGDKVRLNDNGLTTVFGTTLGLKSLKRNVHVLSFVSPEPITDGPDPLFVVEVEDEELNRFMLDNSCFDLVRS